MQWIHKNLNSDLIQLFEDHLNLPNFLAQILVSRNFQTIEQVQSYLFSGLNKLEDPFLLPDMQIAAERVLKAKKNHEKIVIHGDYDTDGTTSVALLYFFFKDISIDAECFIPHRYIEGYGISEESADACIKKNAKLLISVDCGITSLDAVDYLTNNGIDVIITDHHLPAENIPKCCAVVNPQLMEKDSHLKYLAGVGVAFKLAHAVIKLARIKNYQWAFDIDLKNYLDFLAIGTITDMARLEGENRILVRKGLEKLTHTSRAGLISLLEISSVSNPVMSEDISFRVGPRLNASGRVDHAMDAVNLMTSLEKNQSNVYAKKIEVSNNERKRLERIVVEDVDQLLKNKIIDDWFIVLESEKWSEGVVGIAASKLMNLYHKPVLLLSRKEKISKGSARSPDYIHLKEMLDSVSDCLIKYGGHACAAGLTIENDKISELKHRLNQLMKENVSLEVFDKKIEIDVELPLNEINHQMISWLEMLEPFGQGNKAPVFFSKNLSLKQKPKLMGKDHFKIELINSYKQKIEVMGFFMANRLDELEKKESVDILYHLSQNTFRGYRSIQCRLIDFQ